MGTRVRPVQQAYRFALDPTPGQREFLGACSGASRFWFNQGLAEVKRRLDRRAAGEQVSVPWSYRALCSELSRDWRAERAPWQSEVVCGCYQAGFEALGNALRNFSAGRRTSRRVGFPHFRAKGRCHESVIFQYPRILDGRHVELDRRVGPVRVKESMRKLIRLLGRDKHARILRSTVSRSGSKWYLSFTVERSRKQRRARRADIAVGVDVGLARLATLSTGEWFANGRPLQHALRKLRRLQRQLDRQRRENNPSNYLRDGRVNPRASKWLTSERMLRTEERVSCLHERIANLRREQAHQLTTFLTREYGVIGIERLAVRNLLRDGRLARRISDAGWGTILQQLHYKANWSAGSIVVVADRFYPSSKKCSGCTTVKAKLSRSERIFTCAACGLSLDRDLNAALNLAQLARRHAQIEGRECHVAAAGAETENARRGRIRLLIRDEHRPVKREGTRGLIPAPRDAGRRTAV